MVGKSIAQAGRHVESVQLRSLLPARSSGFGHGCIVIAVVLLLALILRMPFGRDSGWTGCTTNLRQIMLGMLVYAEEYDERLPPASSWMDAIEPKTGAVFHCPKASEGYG